MYNRYTTSFIGGAFYIAYIVRLDRNQTRMITTSLDDLIDADNSVRVIDAYVESLNLQDLGLQLWLLLSKHFTQISLGTTHFLLSIYFPHLSCTIPCSYWALTWYAALPSYITSYVISVRQTRDLPMS